MQHRYQQTCRVCGSPNLKPAIDLGRQVLQGAFIKPGQPVSPPHALPMQLVRCDTGANRAACGLLQASVSVPPDALFRSYWYRSATNATMREHLRSIAQDAITAAGADAPAVLDIGCNDGTLLSCFPHTATRVGVDPSNVAAQARGNATIITGFFPSAEVMAALPVLGFDIITSIAVLYDLEDPCAAAACVARLLKPDGIWIFELSYLPLMLLRNSFDTICHEHLEYYSLAVLDHIAQAAGLRIFRAEVNGINGGSIRCFVCHDTGRHGTTEDQKFLDTLRRREAEMALHTDEPYLAFQARAEEIRNRLVRLLQDIRARGQKTHIYGASTKGSVLLQWCGIDPGLVECAADRNPDKVGATIPGVGIPIVSEEESRAWKPDYYLVLPWHFRREFLLRERAAVMAGTRMLFPLPDIDIIDADNYEAATAAPETDLLALLGMRR